VKPQRRGAPLLRTGNAPLSSPENLYEPKAPAAHSRPDSRKLHHAGSVSGTPSAPFRLLEHPTDWLALLGFMAALAVSLGIWYLIIRLVILAVGWSS